MTIIYDHRSNKPWNGNKLRHNIKGCHSQEYTTLAIVRHSRCSKVTIRGCSTEVLMSHFNFLINHLIHNSGGLHTMHRGTSCDSCHMCVS